MDSFETELERAKALDVADIADTIEAIGFECTRCGACCRGHGEEHTATVFPEEVRAIQAATDAEWRDVARPMPFGLSEAADGRRSGETFEWALGTDACGDCTFLRETDSGTACGIYDDRPRICRSYPFSLDLATEAPWGAVVERHGQVLAHECEGLGRDIDRADAEALARTLKERTVKGLTEAIEVRERYDRRSTEPAGVVVYDSEGAKRPDGTRLGADR